MAGKLLVSRNVNKAAEVNSALSPNVGSFGWTSYEAAHFNQLLEYVNFVKEKSAVLEGQITYIDLRISDAEKALQNVYKALENTVLKYDDFLIRYESVVLYLAKMKEMYDQAQNIIQGLQTGEVEDNYNGFYEMEPGNSNFVTVTLNASDTQLGISQWGLPTQVLKFTALVTQGTGNNSVTWSNNINWPQSSDPVMSTDIGKVDIFEFVTTDGGNTWFASVFGRDYK